MILEGGAMLPKKPKHIISNIIHHRKSVDYWLGIYKASQREKRHFINCLGIGFDAEVTKQANQAQLKKIFNYVHMGKIIYLIALIGELIRYKPIQLRIKLDGKIKHVNRCFLITVNNHPYFGGGMKINPQAKNAHDTLSILIIVNISKCKVLALFGTVFLGKHLLFKEVKTYSAHQITIYTDKYQVDDETNYIQQVAVWKKPIPIQITGMSNVKEAQATLNR